MKNIKLLFFVVSVAVLQISCDNESISLEPQGAISSEVAFTDPGFAAAYLNAAYNGIPHGYDRGWYMLASATDDAENSYAWPASNTILNQANITTDNSPFNWYWSNSYFYIRSLNLMIQRYNELVGSETVINRIKGEAHFLRGYYYALLLQTYGDPSLSDGGVPLIAEPQELDDDLLVSRASYDETLDFIVADLDTAAGYFENATVAASTRGSWDAVMALKGRVLLYNGKYTESAAASKMVLDNTSKMLDSDYESVFLNNDAQEVIFDTQFSDPDKEHSVDIFNTPKEETLGLGGWGGTSPTQNLVDQYEMQATGLLPEEAGSGYDPANPYAGRDPRFYASILYDGAFWRDVTWEFRPGGFAGIQTSGDWTRTGYTMKKFLDEDLSIYEGSTQHWIYLRLAEVYLNYAEALIESGTDLDLAVDAINTVRARAEMPPITNTGQAGLREAVRHERRIELAFEEHRFWDIRRWGIAGDPETLTIYRVDMDGDGNLIDDGEEIWETRNWFDSNVIFPIPQSEMDKNPNLTQNTGY